MTAGMRRNALAWLLAASTFLVGAVWQAHRAVADDATRWVVVGGPIGDRGEGWHVITDGHSDRHLGQPRCRGRYLSVPHTRFVDVPIWSVDVDETLRRWDITAGVSGTHDEARVFFDRDGRPISCWHRAFSESLANVWLLGQGEMPA